MEAGTLGGRNLHVGVCECATGTALNGLALSNIRPIGSTLLTFSDYMKPPIRLSALTEERASAREFPRGSIIALVSGGRDPAVETRES